MRRECIEELINGNREIIFRYHNQRYSIGYYNDNREKYISVGEYNGDFIDVKNADEVFNLIAHNIKKNIRELDDSNSQVSANKC